MNTHQHIALDFPCNLEVESLDSRYAYRQGSCAIRLVVNAGFESLSYNGPVWHASAVARPGRVVNMDFLRASAHAALLGVGDASLGYWEEWRDGVYHLYRRISGAEQAHINRRAGEVLATQAQEALWRQIVQR